MSPRSIRIKFPLVVVTSCLLGVIPSVGAEQSANAKGPSNASSKQANLPPGVTDCSTETPPGDSDPPDLNDEARKLQESGTNKFWNGLRNRSKTEVEAGADDLEKGLKIDPRMPGAYSNLATCYLLLKRDPQITLSMLTDGLTHNPKSSSIQMALGNTLSQLGKPKEAISHFLTALDLGAPCKDSAYLNIGNAYLAQRNWSSAIANYQKALDINPGLLKAQKNLAMAHYHAGDRSKAKTAANRLLEMDPDGQFGAWERGALRQLDRP
jgi:tetratricopeptide (TPR) repeat protein